jgi:hypothetical protein
MSSVYANNHLSKAAELRLRFSVILVFIYFIVHCHVY